MGRVKSGRTSSLAWQRPSIRTDRRRLRRVQPLIEHPLERRRTRRILRRRRPRITYTTLEKLRMYIEGLGKAGFAVFRRLLDERELAIVKRRVIQKNPESQESIGKSFSLSKQRIGQIERELLEKIERWTRGKRIGRKMIEGRAVRRIKAIIGRKMLVEGKTLSEIKKEARLNEFQCKVLDIYIMPIGEKRITREKAAKRVGKKLSAIANAVRIIEKKLAGTYNRRGWGKAVKEIRNAVEKLRSQGKTMQDIKSEAGLHETQIRVFDTYMSSKRPITRKEAAKSLGIPVETLKSALRTIKKKLRKMVESQAKGPTLADKL